MPKILAILSIFALIGLVIYIIFYLMTCIKIPLQTVNCYTGPLGSGKTTLGTTNGAIKERNRSIWRYWIKGKYFWHVLILETIGILYCFNLIAKLPRLLALIYLGLIAIFYIWKLCKCRKKRKYYYVREVYSNFPILLMAKKKWKRWYLKESTEHFEARMHKRYDVYGDVRIVRPNKKWKRYSIVIFSKALKKGHILGTIRVKPSPIIICDEASQLFPNNNKKSDIIVEEAIRWFRQHTSDPNRVMPSGSLYLMDQSVGSLDISIRRRIGDVYRLSNFHRKFWFFYVIDVDRIKYAEDLIINTNNITDWSTKHMLGLMRRKRFDSCYHRLFYRPKNEYDHTWTNLLINPDDPNVNDITVGYGSVYNNDKTIKQ